MQYDEKQVSVTSFAFADEENGWSVGIRYLSRKGVHHQPFVFRTNNHGQVWSDVSEKIVRHCSEYKDGFGDPINDGLMGIVHGGSDGAVAVSANGLMFRTRDRGTNWELLGSIPDEDEQAGIRRFGANANKFWWVAGTRSIEGTRGILAMGGVGSPWSSFVLSGVNFTDAAPLSSDEFVISGESLQPDSRSIKKTNGVILHSSDGGKNWKTIFSDSEIGRVNAVSFVSGKIWAVADKGTILNLTPLP